MTNQKKRELFNQLYNPIHEKFVGYCNIKLRNNHDIVNDIINDTVLVAIQKVEKIQHPDKFLSYLIGIANNLIRNHYRKIKMDYMHSVPDQMGDDYVEKKDNIQLLYSLLDQLQSREREAIILHEIAGFKIKEIKGIQGGTESGVKVRLMRARRKLKEIVEKKETLYR